MVKNDITKQFHVLSICRQDLVDPDLLTHQEAEQLPDETIKKIAAYLEVSYINSTYWESIVHATRTLVKTNER